MIPLLPWRVFWAVAVERSFTRAAERLHLSQPTVSFHIQALEAYYGSKLLYRTAKGVSLTPGGETLFRYVQRLMALEEEARLAVGGLESLQGQISVGASHTVGEYLLPPLLASFGREHPGFEINLVVENSRRVASRVADDQLDFGFIEDDLVDARLKRDEWGEDELIPMVAPDHPLAERSGVTLAEILTHRLIVREPGSGLRRALFHALEVAGFSVFGLNLLEVSSLQAMKALAAHGGGVAFLSPLVAQNELASGALREIRLPDFQVRRRIMLLRRERHLPPGARSLYRFLLSSRSEGAPPGDEPRVLPS